VPQGADLLTADVHPAHAEEPDLLQRLAVQLLDHLPRVRALDLEPPQLAGDRLAVRPGRRPWVEDQVHVVAGRALVEQPVGDGRAADEGELLLGLAEQDAIPDDPALGRDGNELLGRVHGELGGGVDPGVGDQLQRVRAGDKDIVHVVRLVVEHSRLPPGDDLAAEVRELGRDDGVDVGAKPRIPQQLDRVPCAVKHLLQIIRHLPPVLIPASSARAVTG
jgi:hypothetical protein